MKDNFPWHESQAQLSEVAQAYKEVVKRNDLRDYFAAMAMQGLIVADVNALSSNSDISRYSYEMADAMLKEREKWKQ